MNDVISLLSIVVPCYNEQASLPELHREVMKASDGLAHLVELVLVDDGSTDGTMEIARTIATSDKRVRVVSLSRNFGKEAAMLAGLRAARGEAVVLMDGDLQHPPSIIPALVEQYEAGYHQVIAKRNRSGDPRFRRMVSCLYYRMVDGLMDVPLKDGVGDFRLLSRAAVDAVTSLSEVNRFSKGLFSWIGFRSTTLTYENVARRDGGSKWTLRRLVNYGIDGVLSFNNKPLRSAIVLGGFAFALFVLYLVWLFANWLTEGIDTPGYLTTIAVLVGVSGVQLLFLGVIGEYVGRIYYEAKGRPVYLIQEEVNRPHVDKSGDSEPQCDG